MSKYFDSKNLTFMEPRVIENGNHMVMTNVHPETKTKYLNIDTRFQDEYNMSDNADYTVTLPQPIRDVQSIQLTNVEIPASFYPFSVHMKNTYFSYTNANGTDQFKLDDGYYTKEDLVDTITTKITGITATLNDNGQCIIKNTTTSTTITFDFAVDENGNTDKYNLKSKLGWCLGFREPSYEIAGGAYITSEGIVTANPCRYLFVSIDDFHSHNPNSFIVPSFQSYFDPNIITRVTLDPNTYTYGGLIAANISGSGNLLSDVRTYTGKNDIQKLRIRIFNEFGQIVHLNKMDVSFALEIKYK
jgi:hypothetical protein